MTTRNGFLFADILVADRSPDVARALRVLLQSAGYIVRSAYSEEEMLQAVLAQPPDLILLDAALCGEDSYHAVRQLRAQAKLPFIPIILLKSVTGQEDIAAALNAGADEIIARPIDNAELLMRIRAMLRLKATTDALQELNQTLEYKVVERTRALEEAHARLRHAEKLSALGRMAASVAHEINNPLTAILGHIFLLKEALDEGSPLREDVAVIEQEVNAIARLVRQLRDISKPPQRERRLIDLNAVADSTLNLLSKELQKHRIQIVRQFDPALPPVLASPD